ncbi:predicted protein [Sclerotinia sclerotiorum 1980 UF-70]|uniref:Uncharacterized protein n=1 Tax=Sclerotinia sclerotiorum (strain ATCC 18683 / 1980 / Ss-1) TaxID=665079 RepID=A7ET48_SCLS1|nr:predicted protein [Sclerotinia sclerotiorum 1980 UF-70]EDN92640.1 predicted protein [Sclerotinia sclerotiorum 1980 UF-70]
MSVTEKFPTVKSLLMLLAMYGGGLDYKLYR